MRLWSIHPKYLDSKGLVALWREGLLAQKVLLGETKGYRNHPQLDRFWQVSNSSGAISSFLRHVANEADRRDYHFDRSKISAKRSIKKIAVTSGQIEYEFSHLLQKLESRDRERFDKMRSIVDIEIHPIFYVVDGRVEKWEVTR